MCVGKGEWSMGKEVWRDVVGFEGKYMVSNDGRVKSLSYMRTGVERELKQQTDKDGYKTVCIGGSPKKVHRLVALAFIPNPSDLPMINHKDENKTNNNVDNLEWCDSTYNNNYSDRVERASKTNKTSLLMSNSKFKSKPIFCHENNKIYISQTQASKELNINDGNIGKVARGLYKHTHNYTFSYPTQEQIEEYIENNIPLKEEDLWMIYYLETLKNEN